MFEIVWFDVFCVKLTKVCLYKGCKKNYLFRCMGKSTNYFSALNIINNREAPEQLFISAYFITIKMCQHCLKKVLKKCWPSTPELTAVRVFASQTYLIFLLTKCKCHSIHSFSSSGLIIITFFRTTSSSKIWWNLSLSKIFLASRTDTFGYQGHIVCLPRHLHTVP